MIRARSIRPAALAWGAALAIGASRYALRARVPDDYDAIGFVLALTDFDLAKFQPHFPGYPVYVALGRLAAPCFTDPLDAAELVSAGAAAVTAAGLFSLGARLGSPRQGALAVGLYAVAASPFILGGAALSDGTAAAFLVLAFAALAAHRPALGGAAAALMLGARASAWPLALSWLAAMALWRPADRLRATLGFAGGLLAWAVPFVLIVGPDRLRALGAAHLRGHFTEWGGSVATRPGLMDRGLAFARDLLLDGIAPRPWAAAVVLGLAALALTQGVRRRAEGPSATALAPPRARPLGVFGPPRASGLRVALVVAAPYAAWVFFGQNVVEQPRHVLPLVLLLVLALARAFERAPRLGVAATLAAAAASVPLAIAHARVPPAAAQAARYLREHAAPGDTAVFGGRAIRFFRTLAPEVPAYERTWLAEVDVALERLDRLPSHVLVTSEVQVPPGRAAQLVAGPIFCRDAALDRAAPCLALFTYHRGERTPP